MYVHALNLKKTTLDLQPYFQLWSRELTGLYNARELQNMWRILCTEGGDLNIPEVIDRLKNKEPFDYVLGHSEFYGLPIKVNSSVLIPRPETEELVDWILNEHDIHPISVLDIGTGSGCIAVALAVKRPSWKVTAVDISEDALEVAKENASLNGVEIRYETLNILRAVPDGRFDIVISNPPYIPKSEEPVMSASTVQFEPKEALFTEGEDALVFYRRIAALAKSMLNPNGRLYFELNEFRAKQATDCIQEMGYAVEVRNDMQGKQRMLKAVIN